MANLNTVEIKAFVPSKDYALSKQFYQDLGFTLAFDAGDVCYFHYGDCSFLLQNFFNEELCQNFMMHLLVENVDDWYLHAKAVLEDKYQTKFSDLVEQPWLIKDFCFTDPSGVLWRIGQNMQ